MQPDELAADARACVAAGADGVHFHPRSTDGRESLCPEDIAAAIATVRAAVPGTPLSVATGFWIGGESRLDQIARWRERPDDATVNMSEPDAPQVIALLARQGIGVEAGVWSSQDALRLMELCRTGFPGRLSRVVIELTPLGGRREYEALRDLLLPLPAPLLLHGEEESVWPTVRLAGAERRQVRVGCEDSMVGPDGHLASNAEMIAAASRILGLDDGAGTRQPD